MSNDNTNSARRDYTLGNRITGWAREAPKKYTPSLAKKQTILAGEGQYSTIFAVSIKPATQQYPRPALNVQMSNGNGSAFQRISSVEELRAFAHQIAVWADELEHVWAAAVLDGERLASIQMEVETRANMFKEMMENMPSEPAQYDGPREEYSGNSER